ncbi:mannose-1-phosphate guanylyltransferase [Clostridium tertium]|uniref:mannose-1-phosphate guanylyltransferase n=1 Tax=Clostridium tertium TaxID=1559 RepID=UPI00232E8081|nr:mannose-1-phosphate guanylyltransferase [Clostridium tertium]MDB1921700.1 mannose-1-phosphate guanylyltransferase [Clostridium tertium]MDB1924903.1 mannose-1-phosphate guanylyltransferase [Clostridium tertium]MDB1929542.1 mannose-1-phosphate guanylyltransferase [Clostridium tertium]
MNICALIMAGGKGTRFWPLSTEEKPKQFLNLVGNKTMIQMTIDRILPIIPIERIFVCTGEKYINLLKEQIPNLPDKNIIVEPEGRNTAPCIALSAFVIKRYYKDSTMVVLPSDHLINCENKFRDLLILGSRFLEENSDGILTLGMKPDRPETGYGYIKFADEVKLGIKKVNKFVEKPNLEVAKKYLSEGTYLWNGGMFLWKTNYILNEIKKYVPNTYEVLHNISNVDENVIQDLINTNYSKTDSISIDYAVLEKSDNIFVLPSEIGWDDIGTWKSVERYKEKDEKNNIINDNTHVINSTSNMIVNNNKKMVMIGIDNTMAIETEDTIFIVNKEYMDNLRDYQDYIL